MKNAAGHVFEMIIGAIVFALGMVFLLANEELVNKLTDNVNDAVIDNKELYQQDYRTDINLITDEELCAIVIGYREYPITIDGTVIHKENIEYEDYVALITEGYYIRSYDFDTAHNICGVIFTYTGT